MKQLFLIRRILGGLGALAFCLTLIQAAPAMAQDVAVIANKAVPVSAVSAEDIRQIFLGMKTTWDSGEDIIFAVCDDSGAQEPFLKQYVRKSPSQYKNYWKSMVFTGKGAMPASFKTKDEVTAFVSATPGAISFVPAPADASVKTISVQ